MAVRDAIRGKQAFDDDKYFATRTVSVIVCGGGGPVLPVLLVYPRQLTREDLFMALGDLKDEVTAYEEETGF